MNGLAGIIAGSYRVWVLSGLLVSRPTGTLDLRATRVGGGARLGHSTWGGGGEGRSVGPPAGFGPLG
jgi:hypothetical protein